MAVRYMSHQAMTAPGAAVTPRQLGVSPHFIQEDQPAAIESGAPKEPAGAPLGNVGPLLLSRTQDFF